MNNMSPINPIDYGRFVKFAELIKEHNKLRSKCSPGTASEVKIYSSAHPHEGIMYISLEIRGYVPIEEAEKIFNQTQWK